MHDEPQVGGQVRLRDLVQFYSLLDWLSAKTGGAPMLAECDGRMGWPERGIYFFFEPGEVRSDTGNGLRVVRVGTHALKPGSRTTFWNRLSQHRGVSRTGGGNHRGSVFRLHVGNALLRREPDLICETWAAGSSAPREVRIAEHEIEHLVSRVIGDMRVLSLGIVDPAGPESNRGFIERNAIALLSNEGKPPLDPPSSIWLGRDCVSERVCRSGLWNSNHVRGDYDPTFLDRMETLVDAV